MIEVKLWVHSHYLKFMCIVCGEHSRMAGASCTVYEDGQERGDICKPCLLAGPRAAIERVRVVAREYPGEAEWVNTFADWLSASGQWQRYEVLQFMEENAEAIAEGSVEVVPAA